VHRRSTRLGEVREGGWRSVDPPTRAVLFLNPRSGGGRAERAGLAERACALGIHCVTLEPGRDLAALVHDELAGGADALGVAGGDGSLAVVAATASAHGVPFVCIPAGTRNHFARDVGVARQDLIGSLGAFTDGVERRIDLGEVDGRVFLNNVSFGIYGDAVQRERYRSAKLRTLLATAQEVLGPSMAAPSLRIVDERGAEHAQPAVLLVSNNPYALEPAVAPGTRLRLDTGRLGIVVLGRPGAAPTRAVHAWSATSLDVAADARLYAGIDGEAVTLDAPLQLRIRPATLRVRIARAHSELPAALR
jgi:diacylglycerol kinase family enzyme